MANEQTGIVKAPASDGIRRRKGGVVDLFARELWALKADSGMACARPNGRLNAVSVSVIAAYRVADNREYRSYAVNGTRYWVRVK